jgi:hypothetical protein
MWSCKLFGDKLDREKLNIKFIIFSAFDMFQVDLCSYVYVESNVYGSQIYISYVIKL